MRYITPVLYAGLLGVSIYAALAQTAALPEPPATDSTKLAYAALPDDPISTATAGKSPARVGRREVCRQQVSLKHLKKREARDQLQLCVAQARVECLQQAIELKVRGSLRRTYVKSCVAS